MSKPEVKQEIPLRVGLMGFSESAVSAGDKGYFWFPVGPIDFLTGQRIWVRAKVMAYEAIREFRDVVVLPNFQVKEATPVELSYQTEEGPYQRVKEDFPLPTTEASIYNDYKEISFTLSETSYEIGEAANEADHAVPKFEARSILFYADQDCWVRFNDSDRVKHFIPNGIYINFRCRCTKIYVVRDATNGTLKVWSEG